MKKLSWVLACIVAVSLVLPGCATNLKTVPVKAIAGDPQPVVETQLPESKQTKLGLYITAREAYEQWKLDSDKIKVLDCRTPEEYAFVGHAPMAHNIPRKFLTHKFDAEKKHYAMPDNDNFLAEVKKRFGTEDKIFVMCRSGGRSAMSVNILADAGYKNAYNIIDGFEGDKIKDEGSYFDGLRMRNGWKNSGAPWTYNLDPSLVYKASE